MRIQHFTNAKTKAQIIFAVTAKLISAFVFTTQVVQFYFLNPKFPVFNHLLCLYSSDHVEPVRRPCWFSHDVAEMLFFNSNVFNIFLNSNVKQNFVCYISGFLTSKGELVRAILYPKPVDFRFNKDTYFFVGVLGLIALVGLVYTVILKVV